MKGKKNLLRFQKKKHTHKITNTVIIVCYNAIQADLPFLLEQTGAPEALKKHASTGRELPTLCLKMPQKHQTNIKSGSW